MSQNCEKLISDLEKISQSNNDIYMSYSSIDNKGLIKCTILNNQYICNKLNDIKIKEYNKFDVGYKYISNDGNTNISGLIIFSKNNKNDNFMTIL